MSKKTYDKGVRVRAFQHGGERPAYGRPVKVALAFVKAGRTSLNIHVHVGDQRRVAALIEVDASVLEEAAREMSGRAEVAA